MAPTLEAPNARATARYQHVSASKVRQVLALIRGLAIDDAVRTLQLCEKEAAEDILKVLDSAVANAEHNFQLPPDELYVALAWADEGPTRKWGQPRARGRYFRVRKRTSHITIIVARYDEDEMEAVRRKQESTGRGAAVQQRRRAERVRRSRQAAHDHDEHDHAEEPAPEDETTLAGEAAEAAEGDYVDIDEAVEEAEPEPSASSDERSESEEDE